MNTFDFDNIKVGDIIGGTYGYNCTLPAWYRVVRKTAKRIYLVELEEEVLSGSHNGYWFSIPSSSVRDDKQRVGSCKGWAVYVNDGYGKIALTIKYNSSDDAIWCTDLD